VLKAILDCFENKDNIPLKKGKVALYSHVALELSKYSTRPNPWTWRYIDGIVTGRVETSRYMQQAIEKLHDEITGKPPVVPVPACPICGLAHTHSHDEQVYDPARLATYDPATQEIKPLPQPSPSRSPRLVAAVNQPLYKWVISI